MTFFLSFQIEPNWGLPLAIAANLHIPFRIEIGLENIEKVGIEDKRGKGKYFSSYFLLVNYDKFCEQILIKITFQCCDRVL